MFQREIPRSPGVAIVWRGPAGRVTIDSPGGL